MITSCEERVALGRTCQKHGDVVDLDETTRLIPRLQGAPRSPSGMALFLEWACPTCGTMNLAMYSAASFANSLRALRVSLIEARGLYQKAETGRWSEATIEAALAEWVTAEDYLRGDPNPSAMSNFERRALAQGLDLRCVHMIWHNQPEASEEELFDVARILTS